MTDNHISNHYKGKSDVRLTVLTVLYFAGVLLGTALYCMLDGERLEILNGITGNLVYGRLNHTFWETLVNSFSGAFMLLLLCFWMGFSAAAQPIEVLVPIFRGMGAGVAVSGIYYSYGASGIGIAAVLIIPGAVISAFAVIIAAREALDLSGNVYLSAFGKNTSGGQIDFRLYFTKFVILCVILAASSFADSVLTFLFAGFWTGLVGI
ncbi:MAG: hypothetical protein ACI4KG_08690 [Oscillospiraceae bacterium]